MIKNSGHVVLNGNIRKTFEFLEKRSKNNHIVIFPEGQRSDVHLGKFQSGFAYLAQRTSLPVVPIGLSGCSRIWPKHRAFPKFFGSETINVNFGKPLKSSDFSSRYEFVNAVRNNVKLLMGV